MADEAASLLVRITGDASQLEATISGVARSLSALEKGGYGISDTTQKAIDKVSNSTRSYADVVAGARKQLDEKNAAMKRTESEYGKTKSLVDQNIKVLSNERDQVEKLMKEQQGRIDRYEEMNRVTKKNSAAYKLNEEQLEKEHTRMKALEIDYNDLTGRIDYQNEVLANSQSAYKTAKAEADKAGANYRTLSENMAEVTRQEKALRLQDTGKHWQEVGEGIDEAAKPIQNIALATAAGGVAAAKFAIDFEDDFAAVKKTVDGTPEQLETIRQGIIDLTTVGMGGRNPLPMTTEELTALAAAGGQLGIQTDNILEFTEVMAQLGTATNLVGEEGAQDVARFMNVMQESQGNVRNVGSAVVDLGNNMATTEAEIISMSNRMGKYGNTVGMHTADVLGYSAALSSLGVEAQLGGSAVGRTWLSIETAVASGGEALEAFAKFSNKSAKEFAEAWDTDASGTFMELLKGLNEADNLTLALDELGINNTQDIQAIMAMATNYELVAQAVERANTAYRENTALQDEFDAKAETTASKLAVMKNNIVEAARGIGETMLPAITDMSTGAAEFAQKLAGLDEDTQKTIVKIGAGLIIAGASAKGLAGGAKTIGTLVESFGKLKATLPALSAVAPALIPVAGTAAGIAAVAIGLDKLNKAAEEAERKRINFSVDTDIAAADFETARSQLEEMSRLADEFKGLQLKIGSGELQGDELAAAQARLEEIAAWFEQQYNVKLEVDSSDVVTAAENVDKLDSALQKQSGKSKRERDDLYNTIIEGSGDYRSSGSRQQEYEAESKRYSGLAEQYLEAVDVLESWAEKYDEITSRSYNSKEAQKRDIKQLADEYRNVMREKDLDGLVSLHGNDFEDELESARGYFKDYSQMAEDAAEDAQTISDSGEAYRADMLTWLGGELDAIKESAAAGEDYARSLEKVRNVAELLGKDDFNNNQSTLMNYAIAAAEAQNGLEGFSQAAQTSREAVQALTNDALANMTEWGVSTERSVKTLADSLITAGVSAEDTAAIINNSLKELGIEDIEVNIKYNEGEPPELEVDDVEADVIYEADTSEPDNYQPDDENALINYDLGTTPPYAPDIPGIANYSMGAHPTQAPDIHGTAYYTPVINWGSVDAQISSKFGGSAFGDLPRHFATGTQNFTGGLARVNDQRGIPDPRELIIDNGRAFIPEGRDVILPLSKGAKVYTASQTKAIMRAMGIPSYASGKNNSEAFTASGEDWTHYINTHAVTTTQELEKWTELSKQFTDNIADAEEIEEEIYKLTRQRNEELNDESKKYIELRTAMNDWEETGDTPLDAYRRIQERNLAELEAERLTWEEYSEIMAEAGSALYEGRLDQSREWLEHQREYNDMSVEDYIAGLQRMASYTKDYYEQGLIDYETFRKNAAEIDEEYLDAVEERNEEIVDAYFKSADNYKRIRDTFDDWEEVGDSEIRYYTARLANVERLKREGYIGWQEYMDTSMDEYLSLYEAVKKQFDNELEGYRDHIDSMEEQFRDEEQALRDSWEVEDRGADLDEVNRLLGIYENAATDQGQQKYKELLEQKKQLEREEQLYQLEQKNNAALEELEANYDRMEAEKNTILKNMRTDQFNIFAEAENISADTSELVSLAATTADAMANSAAAHTNVLYQILNALQGLRINQTTYQDGRQITISRGLTESAAERLINGTIVTGMGTVKLYR